MGARHDHCTRAGRLPPGRSSIERAVEEWMWVLENQLWNLRAEPQQEDRESRGKVGRHPPDLRHVHIHRTYRVTHVGCRECRSAPLRRGARGDRQTEGIAEREGRRRIVVVLSAGREQGQPVEQRVEI